MNPMTPLIAVAGCHNCIHVFLLDGGWWLDLWCSSEYHAAHSYPGVGQSLQFSQWSCCEWSMSLIYLSSIARLYCLCLGWLHCECLWSFCWFSSRFIQYRCCYVLCSYCMINYRIITRTMISSIPRERITSFIATLWTNLVSIKQWSNSMLWVSKFLLLNAMMWV